MMFSYRNADFPVLFSSQRAGVPRQSYGYDRQAHPASELQECVAGSGSVGEGHFDEAFGLCGPIELAECGWAGNALWRLISA
jgi:hypothetical protein